MIIRLNKTVLLSALFLAMLTVVVTKSETAYGAQDNTSSTADGKKETPLKIRKDLPPLPIESIGKIATLPVPYPDSWALVDDVNFFSMLAGKLMIIDTLEKVPAKRVKGIIDKSLMGNVAQSAVRNEIYIIESFHEKGTRGPQYEYLSIYDKKTLTIKKEMLWPTDRLQALPERFAMSLSADEKFLYVTNFTPATSFSVVDLDSFTITDTIDTPGCTLTYPTGKRGVTSICSNGGLLSVVLNDQGQLKSKHAIAPFFDPVDTPVFEHFMLTSGKAYIPSFTGTMHVLDMSNNVAVYEGSWDMLSPQEREKNYRPAGLVLTDHDDKGNLYIIMQKNGHEGTHQKGGGEIWVFDGKKQKRLSVLSAPDHAISLAVTRGEKPYVIVTNGNLALDIIDPLSGERIQTIANFGAFTPLSVFKAY